jgi:hypothetical protein
LAGEFELSVGHELVGGPDPGGASCVLGGAGGDLDAAELLAGRRWLLVGVVLAAGEHAPEQHRDLRAIATIALPCPRLASVRMLKACSGLGCSTALHAACTSARRAEADPRLEIPPLRAGCSPDCLTFGSEPR